MQRVSASPALPSSREPVAAAARLRKRSLYGSETPSIVEVDRFAPEIDELWNRTQGDYPVIVPRDARFLNWRFVDCPEPRYRCFVAQRRGRAVGYVVLRGSEPSNCHTESSLTCTPLARTPGRLTARPAQPRLLRRQVSAVDCGTSVADFETVLGPTASSEPGHIVRPASAETPPSVIFLCN